MDLFWGDVDDAYASPRSNQNEASSALKEDKLQKDGSVDIPEKYSDTVQNCIVVTGSIGKFGHGQSEHYDLVRSDNITDSECDDEKKNGRSSLGLHWELKFALGLCILKFTILIYHMLSTRQNCISCASFMLWLFWNFIRPSRFNSTRHFKWRLDEFSEEMSERVFTSPTIHDKSGSWGLVFRQTAAEEISFGLVAKHIEQNIAHVVANIEISVTIVEGGVIPGMNDIKFVQKFACDGDYGFSPRIPISYEQLKDRELAINCRISFSREVFSRIVNELKAFYYEEHQRCFEHAEKFTKYLKYPGARISGNGVILPENKFQYKMSARQNSGPELEGDFLSFTKDPQTKVFYWKIPDFPTRLKNGDEFWELFSPQLPINSHNFCSVWRLRLIEIQGAFRVRMQLRGLPRGISQIKMRHLLELVDNFGECVVPKHCGNTMKNPQFLHLWDTHRVILYPREAILERFVGSDSTLSLRISLQCEPNDTVKILEKSASHTEWILHN